MPLSLPVGEGLRALPQAIAGRPYANKRVRTFFHYNSAESALIMVEIGGRAWYNRWAEILSIMRNPQNDVRDTIILTDCWIIYYNAKVNLPYNRKRRL